MGNSQRIRWVATVAAFFTVATFWASSAAASPFFFSTGDPDGRIATASRPSSASGIEIESADDFILPAATTLTSATFTGLLTGGATLADIGQVVIEIYRVFPKDSDTGRTPNVPTRANSPSDVAFDSRDSAGTLTLSVSTLGTDFTAGNSVLNGINPAPNQTTGGEGPVTGMEVLFSTTFTTPIALAADHYFFIPQVTLSRGNFMWLSAPRPVTGGTGPFVPDLQSWIRDGNLDPAWVRIGTDLVGGTPAPTFNATFSLTGETATTVPEPATLALLGVGLAGLAGPFRRRH